MKQYCSRHFQPANFSLLNWDMIKPDQDGRIYWHIVSFTEDKHKTILAFTQAFDIWQQAFDMVYPVGRVIKLTATDDFYQGDKTKSLIRIFFMQPGVNEQKYIISDASEYSLQTDWKMDGPGNVLGYRLPNLPYLIFDSSENWTQIMKPGYIDLLGTVIHELGHIWDLGHSSISGSIMESFYSPGNITLKDDDKLALYTRWSPIKTKLAGGDVLVPPKEKKSCWQRLKKKLTKVS